MAQNDRGGVVLIKYDMEIRERALAMLCTDTLSEVARKLNIPKQTIYEWQKKSAQDGVDVRGEREKQRKVFAQKAYKILIKSLKLAERRIDRALDDEQVFNDIAEAVTDAKELDERQKTELRRKVGAFDVASMGDIMKVVSVMYRTQALNLGEPTEIVKSGGVEDIPDARLEQIMRAMEAENVKNKSNRDRKDDN